MNLLYLEISSTINIQCHQVIINIRLLQIPLTAFVYFIFKTMAASVVATPLNELDVMLQDLSKGHYAASGASANDYSVYSDFGSFTKASPKASPGPTSPSPASPPSRPTPPKSYKVA